MKKYAAIRRSFSEQLHEEFPSFDRVSSPCFGADHVYETRPPVCGAFFLHLQVSPKSWNTAVTLEMFWAEDGLHPGDSASFAEPKEDRVPSSGRARVGLLWPPFSDYWWHFHPGAVVFTPVLSDAFGGLTEYVMLFFERVTEQWATAFSASAGRGASQEKGVITEKHARQSRSADYDMQSRSNTSGHEITSSPAACGQ